MVQSIGSNIGPFNHFLLRNFPTQFPYFSQLQFLPDLTNHIGTIIVFCMSLTGNTQTRET